MAKKANNSHSKKQTTESSRQASSKALVKKQETSLAEPLENIAPANLPKEERELLRQLAPLMGPIMIPQRMVMQIADEVVTRLRRRSSSSPKKNSKKIESPLFLDTSAIIDGRFFDLVKLGVFTGNLVLIEGVLSELKNIADSKDDIKKERGRRALTMLEKVKKQKGIKLIVLKDEEKAPAVDDKIVSSARKYKGRVVTCDFNLSQKAKISGVISIDIHEVANVLKTQAVPGESFFVKVVQKGKGLAQGVGYLPDGTMIVVEQGEPYIGKTIKVEVSRIIQTDAGKILFAKIVLQ